MRNILYSDSKKCTVYVIDLLLNVTYAPINVNPQRGVRAYVGYLIINLISISMLISILAPSWGNLKYLLPDGGAFDCKFAQKIKCPTYALPPPPPSVWGLTLII